MPKRKPYTDFRQVPLVREHELNAKQSGSRDVLPTDAVTWPDEAALDAAIFGHVNLPAEDIRRPGDRVMLTDRERLILAATRWLDPPLSLARVAEVLKAEEPLIRKHREYALQRLARAEARPYGVKGADGKLVEILTQLEPVSEENSAYPDWCELDRYRCPEKQGVKFAALRQYLGDMLRLTDRQRMILTGTLVMSPPMEKRRIAVAMRIEPAQLRRDLAEAMVRLHNCPPNLGRWKIYTGKR